MSTADNRREIAFGLGTFTGILLIALGISFVILFLSVGLRESTGAFMSHSLQKNLLYGGTVLVVVGLLGRLYRSKLSLDDRVAKYGGTGLFLVGVFAVLVGSARQTTKGAPFLIAPSEKFILLGIAVAFLVAGGLLVRWSARMVGW